MLLHLELFTAWTANVLLFDLLVNLYLCLITVSREIHQLQNCRKYITSRGIYNNLSVSQFQLAVFS